jgi:hypothetical protein
MVSNMQQFYLYRLRDQRTANGHAMPFTLILANGGVCTAPRVAAITFVAQGISVPISRGGPPLLFE